MTASNHNMPASYEDYYGNDTHETRKAAAEYASVDRERKLFTYIYHCFAGCIVIFNCMLVASIIKSHKQRRHFRNWLILHMAVIHILFGGISLPFLAQSISESSAGLRIIALCKLLYFLTDTLEYMSSISIGLLGFYQSVTMMSPRLLKSVSNALLVSVMIILPWLVIAMLTAVLRLTMSEEQYGQCYQVSDTTAETVWFVLGFMLPLLLIFGCFATVVSIACSSHRPKSNSSIKCRQSATVFVGLCLASCVFMRTPFYVIFFRPLAKICVKEHGSLLCFRLTHSLDVIRLFSMLFIPLSYLIPLLIRRRCQRFKSKILCKTLDCSTTTVTTKKQTMELVAVQNTESTV